MKSKADGSTRLATLFFLVFWILFFSPACLFMHCRPMKKGTRLENLQLPVRLYYFVPAIFSACFEKNRSCYLQFSIDWTACRQHVLRNKINHENAKRGLKFASDSRFGLSQETLASVGFWRVSVYNWPAFGGSVCIIVTLLIWRFIYTQKPKHTHINTLSLTHSIYDYMCGVLFAVVKEQRRANTPPSHTHTGPSAVHLAKQTSCAGLWKWRENRRMFRTSRRYIGAWKPVMVWVLSCWSSRVPPYTC